MSARTTDALGDRLVALGAGLMERLEATLVAGVEQLARTTKRGSYDIVTEADRAIEAWLWEEVHRTFPDDGFLGEEAGWRYGPTGTRDWVVDPIDGTANFVNGIPWACSSVGVLASERALAGLIVDPYRREVYCTSSLEGGTGVNGAPVRVASGESLEGRIVLLEVPSGVSLHTVDHLARAVVERGGTARAMGSGALATALVAAGRAHGIVHTGPSIWDVAAGVALVEHAGGVVLGPRGPYVLGNEGPLIAGNPGVCELLQALLEAG